MKYILYLLLLLPLGSFAQYSVVNGILTFDAQRDFETLIADLDGCTDSALVEFSKLHVGSVTLGVLQ
jgi:hypothetical protein